MSLPKVNFYVHEDEGENPFIFACQLIEKHYQSGVNIYIHTDSQTEAAAFDRLLWTFKDISFLPHLTHQPGQAYIPPITIGYTAFPDQFDVLLNLSTYFPENYAYFKQIVEFVLFEPTKKNACRERYRKYREASCELNTYKM